MCQGGKRGAFGDVIFSDISYLLLSERKQRYQLLLLVILGSSLSLRLLSLYAFSCFFKLLAISSDD